MSGDDRGWSSAQAGETSDRREFLSRTSAAAMAGGLVAGYGTFGVMAVRFLYPADKPDVALRFVAVLDEFPMGHSMEFAAPSGATVVIARHAEEPEAKSFVALSSVCPHLGCQVHWEEKNDRFFCPCHNGVFDRTGVATQGPPALAKQSLKKFELQVIDGLLYIEAPLSTVGRPTVRLAPESGPAAPQTREA